MQILHLIQKLQALYNTYDNEYKAMMGEPEIMIDVFEKILGPPASFVYKGFSKDIVIEKSSDGVYDILSSFQATYNELHQIEESKTTKPLDHPVPGQEER